MGKILAVATALYEFASTIPKIWDIFQTMAKIHRQAELRKIKEKDVDYIKRRRAISNALETCKTKEDRRELSIMLAELDDAGLRSARLR
jgi:hypothetical protein